jgi:hypothetical protein
MKRYRTLIDSDGFYPRDRELLPGEEWEEEPSAEKAQNLHGAVVSEVYRFARATRQKVENTDDGDK